MKQLEVYPKTQTSYHFQQTAHIFLDNLNCVDNDICVRSQNI